MKRQSRMQLFLRSYIIMRLSIFTLFFLSLSLTQSLDAQTNAAPKARVKGLVLDNKGKALEGATILIFSPAAGNAADATTLTTDKGTFSLSVQPATDLLIEISMVGYETLLQPIELNEKEAETDLGSLTLAETATALANVVVTARRPFMQMGVDRRTFNVENIITAKGGTAVDVMRTIPGLTVDANGSVQMRNNTPQIFVDGRPTLLTLEQIPGDDIDRIEVITNPSSKYDAGSTGGILNIILKKNRRNGINGNMSVGIGSPDVRNANMSLNYRKGKFNFFVSGAHNESGGIATSEADRINRKAGLTTGFFRQESDNERKRTFSNLRLGVDYAIDQYNAISVSKQWTDGRFGNDEVQQQWYYDAANALTQTGTRTGVDNFGFQRSNLQFNYRRTYEKPGKEWTADFTYSGGNNGGEAFIVNRFFAPGGQQIGADNVVSNTGSGNGDQYTFQTDYVNPLSENSKLELGARLYHNLSNDKLDVFNVAQSGNIKLPLSNDYGFREMIHAVYGNYSNVLSSKWKYQGGLRIEQSNFRGELKDSAQSFGYIFPGKNSSIWNALFPSLFLTHTLAEGKDLQFNFARRIRRPNFWQINPYVDINDPQNIRRGNPEIQPEFTNSIEANYSRTMAKGTFFAGLYFHNNTRDITSFTDTISADILAQLDNAAINPDALLTTFINADRTNRYGVELTWQYKPSDRFDMTPNFNAQYRDVKANVGGLNLSNTGFNWNFRMSANYSIKSEKVKVLNNIGLQLLGEYESPRVIPQGRTMAQYGFDFAVRKDFLKQKNATLTFNVNDVLNSRIRGSITDTDSFFQEAYRRWNVRTLRLTLSYRFGNKDLQFFKRREGGGEGFGGEG